MEADVTRCADDIAHPLRAGSARKVPVRQKPWRGNFAGCGTSGDTSSCIGKGPPFGCSRGRVSLAASSWPRMQAIGSGTENGSIQASSSARENPTVH